MKETVNTVQHRLPFLVYGILILMGKVKRHADQRINGGNQYPTKHVTTYFWLRTGGAMKFLIVSLRKSTMVCTPNTRLFTGSSVN